MSKTVKIICLFFIFTSCQFSFRECFGQTNHFIPFRKYTQSEGLSSYNITKILKDSFGFLWIGTQDGLNRFDGRNYLILNSDSRKEHWLTGSNVSDMVEDTMRNLLWVATSYGGISAVDLLTQNITLRLQGNSEIRLAEKWIRCINVVQGKVWIGTSEGLYTYDIEKKKYLRQNVSDNPGPYNISKIFVDAYKRTWVFSDKGISVFDGISNKHFLYILLDEINYYNNKKPFNVWDGVEDINYLLVATSWGLRQFVYDSVSIKPAKWINDSPFSKEEVFACRFVNKDQLWLSTNTGLFILNPQKNSYKQVLDTESKLDGWQSAVYSIYNDRNNIYIGSQEGLAFLKTKGTPFTSFFKSVEKEIKIQHAYSVLPVNDSEVYCGTNDGLYLVNVTTRSINKIKSGTSFYLITHLPDSNILVSCDQGIFIIKNQSLIPASEYYSIPKFLNNDLLNSSINYNGSIVLFGSQNRNGLYYWNIKTKEVYQINTASEKLALKDNAVNALYRTSDSSVLVLADNMISLFNPLKNEISDHRVPDPRSGKAYDIFFDICETKESYWIAAYGTGLIEIDKKFKLKKVVSSEHGLCNNGVYKVFSLSDSLILVTSNNGISVLNIITNKINNYYQSDGLHSSAFEVFCGNKYDGKIYAGGINGFTIIDPAFFSSNPVPPKLYINNIRINTKADIIDTSNILLKSIAVSNNALQTTILFSALSYFNPERTTYSYKIKELHNQWIALGNQDFVNLIGISPGTYHLQVQAFNEDGVPSEVKELTLIFLPKWYQTWWFKSLIVLLLIGIVFGLYLLRINQLKKEEKIRNQVAGDLHDELGSTLNSVKIFTNLALMEKENTSHLEKIKEAAQSAIAGVKDIIWVLDDKRDTLDHLLNRINQFAGPICEAAGISYKQQLGGNENYKLGKEEKRNLYMIIKESINNSIKYSDCTLIELLIKNNGGKLNISISDNGKGFDKDKITSGYGLKNIMHRSKEIGYHAEINSSPGNGTLIYLKKR